MKAYRRIWLDEPNIPAWLYEAVVKLNPECRKGNHFSMESQPGDKNGAELIDRIHALCSHHNLRVTGTSEFGTYIYEVVRHYDLDDLNAARLLMLETQNQMFRERLRRDSSGRLMLPAPQAAISIKIASGMLDKCYVASESAKQILEAGDMKGLFFRETVLKGPSHVGLEPLWEIDSEVKLPKMSNSVLSPHFRNGEPHYQAKDLLPLGEFDIARTFEPLGSEPAMIVSQHFYQYCRNHDIPLEARPARIDS